MHNNQDRSLDLLVDPTDFGENIEASCYTNEPCFYKLN